MGLNVGPWYLLVRRVVRCGEVAPDVTAVLSCVIIGWLGLDRMEKSFGVFLLSGLCVAYS